MILDEMSTKSPDNRDMGDTLPRTLYLRPPLDTPTPIGYGASLTLFADVTPLRVSNGASHFHPLPSLYPHPLETGLG